MKILIFGSGSAVNIYIRDYREFFLNNINIMAFVDNDKQKQGCKFLEKDIISPDCICKFSFDLILICSVYEEEIFEQLIHNYGLSEKKIYTRRIFFEKIIFKYYDNKYDLYNKKILIVSEDLGTDKDYKKYYGRYYDLFYIIGVISINDINLIDNFIYDYLLITNFRPLTLQNKNYFEKYKMENKINKQKLLTIEILKVYFNKVKMLKSGGESGNKYLVIRINLYFMGIGAIALMVAKGVAYAKKMGYIPVVDMETLETQYLEKGEYGNINAYNKFFKQPRGVDMQDIKQSEQIAIMYGINWYSKRDEKELVLPEIQDELYDKFSMFKKKFYNKKVLGVLFRGTDYANVKPYGHNIQPDLNTMIQVVREKIVEWNGFDLIFLCTEVQEACKRFEDEFGKEKVCYYPQLRYKQDTKKYLAEIKLKAGERTEQGKDYLIALNCLASCNSIVAGQTVGTKIALLLNNNKYQNSYLFTLGKYGVDSL
ncbi:MAG: hypothetical protein HFH68_08490 [Lachnospiraceae bacterium]|nr:hypothetical protein [Lachnospiraceae bacterium]